MQITREDIINTIKEADVMFSTDNLQDDISLADQGLDSLDAVTVYLLIEEKFDIKIPDADLEKVQTLGDIVNYVNNKK
ncbi:acyl carrier protein [Francisella philomiragia]|uniref:acyl carrier protein n=1 Tax=Francisella philomiragia TaxID=28110 RepID=UPI0019072B33|nr:phosphopantetheine-binding protein [Francisella philomiragia]MBK2105441.1 acyl carrier protein [Francisella philomiragia]